MKRLITILLCVIAGITGAQNTLSVGIVRDADFPNQLADHSFFGSADLLVYNRYALAGEHRINRFRIRSVLGFIGSDFNRQFELVTRHYMSGGVFSSMTTYSYRGHVSFGQLTARIGAGYIVVETNKSRKFWFEFSPGLYFEVEHLLWRTETDKWRDYRFVSNSGTSQTSKSPIPYDMVKMRSTLNTRGVELLFKCGYKDYYLEVTGAIGKFNRPRTVYLIGERAYESSSLSVAQLGVSVGYYFPVEKEEKIPSE